MISIHQKITFQMNLNKNKPIEILSQPKAKAAKIVHSDDEIIEVRPQKKVAKVKKADEGKKQKTTKKIKKAILSSDESDDFDSSEDNFSNESQQETSFTDEISE